MNNMARNVIIWMVIGVVILAVINAFQNTDNGTRASKVAYSDFIAQVESGDMREVTIEGLSLIHI